MIYIAKEIATLSGIDSIDRQYNCDIGRTNLIASAGEKNGFCHNVRLSTIVNLTVLSFYVPPVIEVEVDDDDEDDDDVFVDTSTDNSWEMILSGDSKCPRAITKAGIGKALSLGKTELEQFISECTDNNILLFKKQKWFMNADYFSRGCLFKGQSAQTRKVQKDTFLQIYRNNIDNLDYIGGLLRLSPYLHNERNYLCSNPKELRPNKITPMPTTDIQMVLGRDSEFSTSLLNNLSQITFEYDGKTQQLCRIDRDGKERLIMINPNVIYADNPPEYKRTCLELYWGYEDPFDLPFHNYPRNPIKGSTLAYVNRANT